MSQLTADKSRKYKVDNSDSRVEQPMDAAVTIYAGSFVGTNSGTHLARQLVAGDDFLGIADAQAANVANPNYPGLVVNGVALGVASALNVPLRESGVLVVALADVTGASGASNIDAEVYATDGNTLTLTASGASPFGKVRNYLPNLGLLEIFFQSVGRRSI